MSLVKVTTSDKKSFSLTEKQVRPLTVIRNMVADLPGDNQDISLDIHSVPFSAAVVYSDIIYDTFQHIGSSAQLYESKIEVIEPQIAAMIYHYAEQALNLLGFEELDNMRIPIPTGDVESPKDEEKYHLPHFTFSSEETRDKAFIELNDKFNDHTYVKTLDKEIQQRCWLRRKYHGLLYALDKLGSDLPYHILNEYIHARLMKTSAMNNDTNEDKLDFEAMWLTNPLFTIEAKAKFIESSKYILEEPEPWYLMNNPYDTKYIEAKTNEALKVELFSRTEKFRQSIAKLASEVGITENNLPKDQLSVNVETYRDYADVLSGSKWEDYPNIVFGHPFQPPVKFPDIPEDTGTTSTNNVNTQV
jgi:hypothetical protein